MEAPNLPSMFKGTQKRPRGRQYKPMYYNAQKEEFDSRVANLKRKYQDEELDLELRKVNMENRISNDRMRNRSRAKSYGRSMRLVVVLGVLIAIAFKVLKYLEFI